MPVLTLEGSLEDSGVCFFFRDGVSKKKSFIQLEVLILYAEEDI